MADIKEYKCPACGGSMEFDIKSQQLKCPSCDTVLDIKEYEAAAKEEAEKEKKPKKKKGSKKQKCTFDKESWEVLEEKQWEEDEAAGISMYTCQSCGGEIIADETTGATMCPYCGNTVLVKDVFKEDRKPDYIIPFKYDKKQAKEAYKKHLKGKVFLPSTFKSENHIDEIRGVYVPFWLYDAKIEAEGVFKTQKRTEWVSEGMDCTETKYYKCTRAGKMEFECIPEDGSKKMDDKLMESIEPYDFSEAVPFSTAYLAGYVADRYDVTAMEREEQARYRIEGSIIDVFEKDITGYDDCSYDSLNVSDLQVVYKQALYPVWILNTTWKGNKYVFAMNGQTGKMVGDLPINNGEYIKYIVRWSAVFTPIVVFLIFLYNLVMQLL